MAGIQQKVVRSVGATCGTAWKAALDRTIQGIKLMAHPTSPKHELARNWWWHNYPTVKALNPRLPFQIRPMEGAGNPVLIVEFDFGHKDLAVINMDEHPDMTFEDIDGLLYTSIKSGEEYPRSYEQSVKPFRLPTVIE